MATATVLSLRVHPEARLRLRPAGLYNDDAAPSLRVPPAAPQRHHGGDRFLGGAQAVPAGLFRSTTWAQRCSRCVEEGGGPSLGFTPQHHYGISESRASRRLGSVPTGSSRNTPLRLQREDGDDLGGGPVPAGFPAAPLRLPLDNVPGDALPLLPLRASPAAPLRHVEQGHVCPSNRPVFAGTACITLRHLGEDHAGRNRLCGACPATPLWQYGGVDVKLWVSPSPQARPAAPLLRRLGRAYGGRAGRCLRRRDLRHH